MTVDPDVFSVVLAGAMNPRIHHPSWYRSMGLIDETEEKIATADSNMFLIPNLSQLGFGDFKIICQDGRWEIRVSNSNNAARLIDIASNIFDNLLKHTPVTAFGINFIVERDTRATSVSEVLAGFIAATPLGLDDTGASGADIVLKRISGGRVVTITIRQSKNPANVIVSHSFEYAIEVKKLMEFFEIRERLEDRFPKDFQEATSQVDAVIGALNAHRDPKRR